MVTTRLNERLHILATNTSCPCQRRTQCSADDGPGSGFIVAVALAVELDLKRGPSENDLIERAEKFCRSLEGRWALGDCGNSLIIIGWKHYSKVRSNFTFHLFDLHLLSDLFTLTLSFSLLM
ncbi:unnamed protein product [Enterobius vermicularis]|uniref:RNase H domain-containing protein n=1 Tax=Enterobius vermicularis TaxID=51028 RepID=A0A0N4VL66_ENTVE|nr:unnamed protein product [Enterobius vermicularis]